MNNIMKADSPPAFVMKMIGRSGMRVMHYVNKYKARNDADYISWFELANEIADFLQHLTGCHPSREPEKFKSRSFVFKPSEWKV